MANDTVTWTYAYNADGLRTSRSNGTDTYNYVYNGSQLSQMTIGDNVLRFTYDASGLARTVTWNGTVYYYATNLQGDIIAILDADGNAVVEYIYDAWGNIHSTSSTLAATLGYYNPLRYRGYVYDTETDLYYLQSRYYNPESGRFINTDVYVSTGQGFVGNNMFAYCGNNPVFRADYSGCIWIIPDISVPKIGLPKPKVITPGQTYITNQSANDIGDFKLGSSTVSRSGCGVVATYNALAMMGKTRAFLTILSYYNKWYRLVLNGKGGIAPNTVAQYFRDNGYRVITTDNRDLIDIYSSTANACILWYSWSNDSWSLSAPAPFYAHFVAYRKIGNEYIGYNTSEGNGTYAFNCPSDYGYKGSRNYAIGIFIYKK